MIHSYVKIRIEDHNPVCMFITLCSGLLLCPFCCKVLFFFFWSSIFFNFTLLPQVVLHLVSEFQLQNFCFHPHTKRSALIFQGWPSWWPFKTHCEPGRYFDSILLKIVEAYLKSCSDYLLYSFFCCLFFLILLIYIFLHCDYIS